MSNWHGKARTNYVRVKDMPALQQVVNDWSIKMVQSTETTDPMVAFFPDEYSENGDFINTRSTEDDVVVEFSWQEHILPLLEPGSVLIVVCTGSERLRYLTGVATAYTLGKPPVVINLNSINKAAAAAFGIDVQTISVAEY